MYYPVVLDHRGNPIVPYQIASAYPYEGATYGRRLNTWGTSSAGPNSALFGSLATLRNRQRQLVRNNPLVDGGVDSLVANMVGTGITPRWQVEDSGLKKEIQELWADSVPEMDADGVSSFYGFQAVAAHTMVNGGETLARFVHRSPYEDLIVPLQVQVMEGDHLDESMNELAPNNNEIRMGIEFDGQNRRTAYWIYKNHPGEFFLTVDHTEKIRIPAGDVMHVGRPKRAGQIRFAP